MSSGEEKFRTCKYRYNYLYLQGNGLWKVVARCNPPGSAGHANPKLCEECSHYVRASRRDIPTVVSAKYLKVFLARERTTRKVIRETEEIIRRINEILFELKEMMEKLRRLGELEESEEVDKVVEIEESIK